MSSLASGGACNDKNIPSLSHLENLVLTYSKAIWYSDARSGSCAKLSEPNFFGYLIVLGAGVGRIS